MNRIILISALLLLGACASPDIREFTDEDLMAALALARDDPDGMGCWKAIQTAREARGPKVAVPVAGPLSAIQRARNARMRIRGGVSSDVRRACAIVIWDAEKTIARGIMRFSGVPGL